MDSICIVCTAPAPRWFTTWKRSIQQLRAGLVIAIPVSIISENEQAYGYAAGFDLSQSCEEEVIQQLKDLQLRAYEYLHRDGHAAEDEFFSAEQNARLVRNAEEYYRGMFQGRVNTWNLRDRHMAETLQALAAHLDGRVGRSKIVVWAPLPSR
jgi:erythromycin esterase-like protein